MNIFYTLRAEKEDSSKKTDKKKQYISDMESEQMNEFRPLILVAEDDDSNFKLIKAIIGKKCDIEWAKNGQEMVELFQQHQQRAKAMLMDIKMPVMNGLEATKIIRESNTEIPIIMQTAYAFSSDK